MKKEIRKKLLRNRLAINKRLIIKNSHLIFKKLLDLNIINDNKNILVYMDFRNEVMTSEINNYILNNNLNLLLPKVNKTFNKLTIHQVTDLKTLELSNYNILEPSEKHKIIDPKDIDLIIAPGVAFDKNLYRLGYGGGFYDKLLSETKNNIKVIALAFDIQIIDVVPTEPHDKQMDYIITESRLIKK